MKKKIAIAGASGFIGKWFIETFHEKYEITALSRGELVDPTRPSVKWKKVDLYSLTSTKEALKGMHYGLYLVHSMSPSTRLNQGTFEDTDLLLADNFSRAAEEVGLEQIIFIGGILPKQAVEYSRHLRSRFETEQTLSANRTPLTALRAGIVIGPGGSSFKVVEKLIKRLPVMACPKWCQSSSQPIDIRDLLKIIDDSLGNQNTYGRAIDVGGPETITYMNLLRTTANGMGKKRIIFSIPFFTLGLSKLWVGLFSGSNIRFVAPLVESLRHDMSIDRSEPGSYVIGSYSTQDGVANAITGQLPVFPKKIREKREKNTVRSVQRLPNPTHKSTKWVAKVYPKYLMNIFAFLLKVYHQEDLLSFNFIGIRLLQLQYVADRSDKDRQLYYIVGGKLTKRSDYGWLEFRSVLGNKFVIAAIHEFVPQLPWVIYKYTQAVAHLLVMKGFGNYLKKLE